MASYQKISIKGKRGSIDQLLQNMHQLAEDKQIQILHSDARSQGLLGSTTVYEGIYLLRENCPTLKINYPDIVIQEFKIVDRARYDFKTDLVRKHSKLAGFLVFADKCAKDFGLPMAPDEKEEYNSNSGSYSYRLEGSTEGDILAVMNLRQAMAKNPMQVKLEYQNMIVYDSLAGKPR